MFADGPCAFIAYDNIVFHYVKNNISDRVVWSHFINKKLEGEYSYVDNLYHYNMRPITFGEFINIVTSYLPKNPLDKKAKITINKIFDYYAK